MEDGNKKHYFVKLEGTELVDTFMVLSLENAPVKAWRKGQNEEDAEDYLTKRFNPQKMYVALKPQKKILGFIAFGGTKKNLFFRFGRNNLLTFTTGTISWEKAEYRLYLKEPAFRCQKRSNYRLLADSSNKINLKINDEILDVFDLSASGAGIIIPKSEKKRFEKGREFKNCKVFLNDVPYDIPIAEVASLWEERTAFFKETGNLEVGLKFRDMTADGEERLSRKIQSLAREAEIRKTLLKKQKN